MIPEINQLNQTQVEKKVGPEKPPQPKFLGMLVTPKTIPGAEATFNAAVLAIPNNKTGDMELLSAYRVQKEGHQENVADQTTEIGMQRLQVSRDGLKTFQPSLTNAKKLLAEEDVEKNPEDARLSFDEEEKVVYGAITESMEISRWERFALEGVLFKPGEEALRTTVPLVATIEGKPTYDEETGHVQGIDFGAAHIAFEIRKGEHTPRPLVGKNAWEEIEDDGTRLLRYRPEFIDGEVNQTHFRTLSLGKDGYWHQVREDGVYPTDNLSEILPEGHTLHKFGLNGRSIPAPDGRSFRIDHVASDTPDGKLTEYGFITVNGSIKPLLTYEDAVRYADLKGKDNDLSGDKKVIYCNGYAVIPVRQADGTDRQTVIMAVTFFDKMIGIFSYDLEELAAYATNAPDKGILESAFPTSSRSRHAA